MIAQTKNSHLFYINLMETEQKEINSLVAKYLFIDIGLFGPKYVKLYG